MKNSRPFLAFNFVCSHPLSLYDDLTNDSRQLRYILLRISLVEVKRSLCDIVFLFISVKGLTRNQDIFAVRNHVFFLYLLDDCFSYI